MTMGIDEAYTHKLGILGKEFVQEIIMRKASNLPSNPGISEIVDKIVDRCHGFPLAARAFGSMLSTRTSMQEWKNILDKSNICNEKTGILPILKLSYADLPSHMKQCFAFCAIFPKDYEIDVDNLIQLWLAHNFIPLQQGEHPETVGKEIFKELCWRSFFQDVRKNYPKRYNSTRFQLYYRTTCKIHDLMHDIALSVMGNECVTITDSSGLKKLANTTSHLFSSHYQIEAPLHDFLKNKSATLQTLLVTKKYAFRMVPHLSKHNSMRVLQLYIMEELPIKPRHFQHLRYLNLSGNTEIKELPECISMMYNLQTLDLSHCEELRRLPKYLKYMSSLRHLYTNGCRNLTYMPPDIGRVTCLQTLTYFVVSANSGCSSIRELQNLNLGGELELSGLENASVMHAKAASLGRKEQLSHLSLEWRHSNQAEEPECHEKVLDALKPPGRLQVLRIVGYKSTGLPKWMKDLSVLQNFTELYINGCTMCEEFPEFYRMNGLRILHLESLDRLLSFCGNLASMTFPALKELGLYELVTLERWSAKEASEGAELSFPLLEKADINYCPKLRTLCMGLISTTFSALRELKLYGLESLERWGTEEGSEGDELAFPVLEKVDIRNCPKLTTFPEAPKVQDVCVHEDKEQLSLSILKSNCMSSLSGLELCISNGGEATPQFNQDRASTLSKLELVGSGCAFFFPSGPSRTTIGIWKRFGQLVDLTISSCNTLINWPVEEFLCLVSLKNLFIRHCENLVGHPTQVKGEPTRQASSDQLLPHLNSLFINNCSSLRELFLLPPSLTRIEIIYCPSLEFIWGNKEDNESESIHAEQRDTWTTPLEHCNDHASTSAPEQSSSPTTHSLPCLERLEILFCDKLEALPYLPASLKELKAYYCDSLCSVSGQLDALEDLGFLCCDKLEALDCLGHLPSLKTLCLESCKRLTSLPGDPESYSALERVMIKYCPAINMKPLYVHIQQRLDRLEERNLSHAHSRHPAEGPKLRYPKSWKYAIPGCR